MTLSTRQIRLLLAFAGLNILLVAVGWMALVSPQQHAAATQAAAAQLAQSQLDNLNGVSTHGPTTQPAIHTAAVYSLDTALPSQADTPSLVLELDRLANASGVKLLGISPQAAQANPTGYTMLPINLTLNGTYAKLTTFLRNLRTLVSDKHGRLVAHGPLFAVPAVTLSPGEAKSHTLSATVALQAFYYGVTAGASAPASTTATDTTTTTGG